MDFLILVLIVVLLAAVAFFGKVMKGKILKRLSGNAYFGAFFSLFVVLAVAGGVIYNANEFIGAFWFAFWIGFLWFLGYKKKK